MFSHWAIELSEDDLLILIQRDLQAKVRTEYYRLVKRRKAGTLTDAEYEKLITLTNQVEIAHAERMKYVIALAKLRGVPLEQIILDLGFQKKIAG